MDHLLIHCKFAYALWSEALIMFGVQWVMPDTIVSLLFAWRNWLGTYSSKVWNLVPACLMWLVWKERNARTFEDVESPIDKLKTLLARTFLSGLVFGSLRIVVPCLISLFLLVFPYDLIVSVSRAVCL